MRIENSPVSEALREDVLTGKLPPGMDLIQEELSRRYGVSRIPVREALLRLEADGLAQHEGKRGFVVSSLSAEEAEDIWMMRVRLEPLALSLAFPSITRRTLGAAEDVVEELEREEQATQRGRLNWQFHRMLYEPCGRRRLLSVLDSLHLQADRYMRFQFNVIDNREQSHQEHLEIVNALKNRDLDEAVSILSRHIEQAGQQLVVWLKTL